MVDRDVVVQRYRAHLSEAVAKLADVTAMPVEVESGGPASGTRRAASTSTAGVLACSRSATATGPLVELAMLLETELGVPHVEEDDAVECNTITELVAFLDKVMPTTD
jgi:hypothetical protein